MSRFLIWTVIGTSTVSLVTFTKSVRTSKGIRFVMILVADDFFQILEFDRRAALASFANCSKRSNSLVCFLELTGPAPNCSRPPPEASRLARHAHLLIER
jgi:hypothetical protein